ncbi:hypothetical protein SLA2020_383370 [Shorea laevis]
MMARIVMQLSCSTHPSLLIKASSLVGLANLVKLLSKDVYSVLAAIRNLSRSCTHFVQWLCLMSWKAMENFIEAWVMLL